MKGQVFVRIGRNIVQKLHWNLEQSFKGRRPHMKGQISVQIGKNIVQELCTEIGEYILFWLPLVHWIIMSQLACRINTGFYSTCLATNRMGSGSGIFLSPILYSHRPMLMFCFCLTSILFSNVLTSLCLQKFMAMYLTYKLQSVSKIFCPSLSCAFLKLWNLILLFSAFYRNSIFLNVIFNLSATLCRVSDAVIF